MHNHFRQDSHEVFLQPQHTLKLTSDLMKLLRFTFYLVRLQLRYRR